MITYRKDFLPKQRKRSNFSVGVALKKSNTVIMRLEFDTYNGGLLIVMDLTTLQMLKQSNDSYVYPCSVFFSLFIF